MRSLAERARRRRSVAAVGEALSFARQVCPTAPSSRKWLGQSQTVANGGTATFRFVTPGIFCVERMIVTGSIEVEDSFVISIRSGLEEYVINGFSEGTNLGLVPAELFGIENPCCQTLCAGCIATPGAPFEVVLGNGEPVPQVMTVTLVGSYVAPEHGALPESIVCPPGSRQKIVGFAGLVQPGPVPTTLPITTPGRFCPQTLLFMSDFLNGLNLVEINSDLKQQIISGGVPTAAFSVNNECCILSCLNCLCMPGVPLELAFTTDAPETPVPAIGAIVGTWEDVCEPMQGCAVSPAQYGCGPKPVPFASFPERQAAPVPTVRGRR